jgi:hypothetical protein
MQKNWQDVPRDPIADDDVLETLYKRFKAQGPHALEKKSASKAEMGDLEGRKKQPRSVSSFWPLRKFRS